MSRIQRLACELSLLSDQDLILAFNSQVGNTKWGKYQATYLACLHQEFRFRGWDFSAIGDLWTLCFRRRVRLVEGVVLPECQEAA